MLHIYHLLNLMFLGGGGRAVYGGLMCLLVLLSLFKLSDVFTKL